MVRNVDPNFHVNLLAGAAGGALGIMVGGTCIAGALSVVGRFQFFGDTLNPTTPKINKWAEAFFVTIAATTLSYSITSILSRLLPSRILGPAFFVGGITIPIIMGLTRMFTLTKDD